MNIQQVRYERVNIDDIDTSSEDDDYGDLFSKDRGRIIKGRSKIRTRKGCRVDTYLDNHQYMNWCPGTGSGRAGGCGWWCRGLCVLLLVLSVLLVMAGVALYLDPGDSLQVRGAPPIFSIHVFMHKYCMKSSFST